MQAQLNQLPGPHAHGRMPSANSSSLGNSFTSRGAQAHAQAGGNGNGNWQGQSQPQPQRGGPPVVDVPKGAKAQRRARGPEENEFRFADVCMPPPGENQEQELQRLVRGLERNLGIARGGAYAAAVNDRRPCVLMVRNYPAKWTAFTVLNNIFANDFILSDPVFA